MIVAILEIVATILWIVLAIYGFAVIRNWNARFSELHEQFKRDMEKTE